MYLCLERECGDRRYIDVTHLQELLNTLKLVLKSSVSVLIHISKIFSEHCPIATQVLRQFIPEFKTLMKLYLELDPSSQDCPG